jgi:hypothetical protein
MRDSDFDGLEQDELLAIMESVVKVAVHGTGSNWVRDDNPDPYKTSPLVNYQGPEFGGRWRDPDFAGGEDQQINEKKSDPKAVSVSSDDRLEKELSIDEPAYVVRFMFNDGERPTKELAETVFGEDGRADNKSIYVTVNGYEKALAIQGDVPGSIVEKKGE